MVDIQELRDFAEKVDSEDLPKDNKYEITADRPMESDVIISGIKGKYHALYIRQRLEDEHGHMGVTFSVREE